jgi:hypothetical protein
LIPFAIPINRLYTLLIFPGVPDTSHLLPAENFVVLVVSLIEIFP